MAQLLQFVPFASAIDVGFWRKLTQKKLEEFKLDESARTIRGAYCNNGLPALPSHLTVDYDSFESSSSSIPPRTFPVGGFLYNKNTIDGFKTCDKQKMIKEIANQIWEDIKSGQAIDDPSCLCRFLLLTFADLKKYHYYYWFAFPALIPEQNAIASKLTTVGAIYSEQQIQSLQHAYDELSRRIGHDPGYFLIKFSNDSVTIAELKDYESFVGESVEVLFGFADPSNLDDNPGWPLRNFIALISYHWGSNIKKLKLLCYRDRVRDGKRDVTHSLFIEIETLPDFKCCKDTPRVVGWEKNEKSKLIPKMVNLSSTLNPMKLAESAVDLNLKLMRWRLVPDIDLEKISSTKCLLLGSGTLGCNVARNLMGWGVRKITFVDNSRISFSNPVRQTLFEFEDCKNGGKKKAQAAADSLRRIFPGIKSSAYELTIPMPGHSIGNTEDEVNRIMKDVEFLEKLFDDHDVIFLLMDTRESRWLPTLLGTAKRKIVINAALGFDTFVVMRHGLRKESNDEATATDKEEISSMRSKVPGHRLGCYFCNDVVAPGDVSKSTRDRTLDQQCTVSRPGISMMASALAVELLMSILQHKEGGYAPADVTADESFDTDFESPLGIVPHQLRGFLSRFQMFCPSSVAFKCCTACSDTAGPPVFVGKFAGVGRDLDSKFLSLEVPVWVQELSVWVVNAYKEEGFEFLLKVFNVPKYLEERTGLTELHKSTLEAEIIELSDEESDVE